MTTILSTFGSGGANMTPAGSGEPTLAETLRDIADDLAAVGGLSTAAVAVAATDISAVAATAPSASVVADVGETYGVCDGLIVGAPTTPSSQAGEPGGQTDWNVNISAGYAFVNGVGKYNAAQVDVNVSTGAKIMTVGQAMYAWLVWAEAAGVITQVVVLGTAAALGAETIPDDAAITTGVGHARWTKLALCHASRTLDAVVATTEDASLMKKWGGAGTTLINDIKTKVGLLVTAVLELRTLQGANRTLENEVKSRYNTLQTAIDAVPAALKTIKG